jgi:CheY-like chemotaxis protein
MTAFDQGLVLIVEDDRNTAALVATYLEREGFSTLAVHDGRQALEMIRLHRPGFVILDLMLPGTDGWEICRELRKVSDVPILMLTARVEADSGDEVGDLGAAFNRMADSLGRLERLRKTMVADVAHELRTPLTNLRGYLEGLIEAHGGQVGAESSGGKTRVWFILPKRTTIGARPGQTSDKP